MTGMLGSSGRSAGIGEFLRNPLFRLPHHRKLINYIVAIVIPSIRQVLERSQIEIRCRAPVRRRHCETHRFHQHAVQVEIADAASPTHGHLQQYSIAEYRLLRPRRYKVIAPHAARRVCEFQTPRTHLRHEVEQVITVAVPYIERIPLPRRDYLPLCEAVARFQIERDLPLIYIENIPQRRPREFVIRIAAIATAILKVHAVANRARCEIHRTAAMDHHRTRQPRRSGTRRHGGTILCSAHLCGVGMQL